MYLKGKQSALELLNKLKEENCEFYTTTINISEFFMGYYKANVMTAENKEKLNAFFKILNPKGLDYESAELAGKLFATTLKGNAIGWRDTYIGAIAMLNGKTIITSNKKHFERISELKIIEYY